jgi:hypothetical protein
VRSPRRLGRAAVCPATDRSHLLHVTEVGLVALEQRYETWVAFASRRRRRMDLHPTARALQAEETLAGTWSFDGLAQSTPLLTPRGPRGDPVPTGIDPERVLEVVRDTAVHV